MDRTQDVAQIVGAGFPRTRGDGPEGRYLWPELAKFPPHTRGWTHAQKVYELELEVSPAHAGMDPHGVARIRRIVGFPRTRGDGPVSSWYGP